MDRNKLVLDNINLVYYIANKYLYDGCNRDDLYQAGMLGLVSASIRYDSSLGVMFSTYAGKYILGEVLKFIREDKNLRVGRDVLRLNQSFNKAKDLMCQKLGREPTDMEVCLFLDIDPERMADARRVCMPLESLDSSIDVDSDFNYYDSIKVMEKNMNLDMIELNDVLNSLSDEEKSLIYSRYFDGFTQSELSSVLGISQVQVSRVEKKILNKMKVRM